MTRRGVLVLLRLVSSLLVVAAIGYGYHVNRQLLACRELLERELRLRDQIHMQAQELCITRCTPRSGALLVFEGKGAPTLQITCVCGDAVHETIGPGHRARLPGEAE